MLKEIGKAIQIFLFHNVRKSWKIQLEVELEAVLEAVLEAAFVIAQLCKVILRKLIL